MSLRQISGTRFRRYLYLQKKRCNTINPYFKITRIFNYKSSTISLIINVENYVNYDAKYYTIEHTPLYLIS